MREKNNSDSNMYIYIAGGILGIVVIAIIITFSTFAIKQSKEAKNTNLGKSKIIENIAEENKTESASKEIGKTVEEAKKELKNENKEENVVETIKINDEPTKNDTTENEITDASTKQNIEEKIEFIYPVEGEITLEYARDNLIYSKTLQEWITHSGIDLKADKTTVVKAAYKGMVIGIKNDPRYGLTVIIEHDNGYKTVYANLLTAEFVNEGDVVETGETIGTVGTSAIFESAEEPHLHFEILKDNEYQDPTMLLKRDMEIEE